MTSTMDTVIGESHEKTLNETSLKAIQRQAQFDGTDDADGSDSNYINHGFSRNDRSDMRRMGKVQELGRNFRLFSAISFTTVLQSTWEVLLVATTQGLVDGGLAGLLWSYIWTFIGMGMVIISLAEMASMAPTAGGQYHWVSEFAPPQYQKFLSYFIGWMSALSWQAGFASGPFLVGTIIQALLTVNDLSYEPRNWQGTLFVFAVVLLIFILNVWAANAIPTIINLLFFAHVFGFLAIIVILWVRSPHNTADAVFTQFSNEGGWNSMGLSLMVGQISAIYGLICSDGAAHISEEIQNAGLAVAHTMVWSYVLNGTLGLVVLITYLFCITSVDDALNDPSGYPLLYVLRNTVSRPGLNAICSLLLILLFAGSMSSNISASRQIWAFARDRGLPFSAWIAHVHPRLHLPVNAIALSCAITSLLALINLGSNVAFNAIISLNLVSLMLTYCTSVACVLVRRVWHPELLPRSSWSLGRWGVPINAGGMTYALVAFFWCFWPNVTPVDATSFNWAVVMFVTVAIVSLGFYAIKGKRAFTGPVVLVEGWRGN